MIKLFATELDLQAAAEDGQADAPRTIVGLAVPWDVTTTDSLGTSVRFAPDSLSYDRKPKLIEAHDTTKIRGVVTDTASTAEGLMFEAQIARTTAGDEAVELIKMGALDAVSVGVNPTEFDRDDDGTLVVTAGQLLELSLVAIPAFDAARITEIAAASAAEPIPDKEPEMTEQTPEVVEAEAPASTVPAVQPIWAAPKVFKLPTLGEWVSAQLQGGAVQAEMNARLQAAAPDVTTTNNDGVLPEPIIGDVWDDYVGARPVIDVFGARAMPAAGKVFIRPSVSTHTSMAVQSAELATLQAGEFQVAENQVTKAAYGGYCTASEQVIDWSSPEIVDLMIRDMARIYADTTDNVAADALDTGATVTSNFTAANIGDPTEWLTWLYGAAETILTTAGDGRVLPTHLFVSPGNWAALGKLEDSQGRPLFPQVGPMNAAGTASPATAQMSAFGLTLVVDKNFDNAGNGTMILGDTQGFEIFETQKGVLSVDNATTRSRDVSWLGYFATLMIASDHYVNAAFV